MSIIKNEIDLTPFCEPSNHKPWVEKGHWYATNGWSCIRVETTDADTEPLKNRRGEPYNIPEFEQWSKFDSAKWNDMPTEFEPVPSKWDDETCEACREFQECGECKGQGEVYCVHCDNENDCRKCGGSGGQWKTTQADCPVCSGTRKITKCVRLGKSKLNRYTLMEYAKLPNVKWANVEGHSLLKFDGGQGLICNCLEEE